MGRKPIAFGYLCTQWRGGGVGLFNPYGCNQRGYINDVPLSCNRAFVLGLPKSFNDSSYNESLSIGKIF